MAENQQIFWLNGYETTIESKDIIKIGNSVTSLVKAGNVTTSNADVTLRAKTIIFDKGTFISKGSNLKTETPK